jgi:hypothetical protein
VQSVLVAVVSICSGFITLAGAAVTDGDAAFELEHAANTAHNTMTRTNQYALRITLLSFLVSTK